MNTNIDVTNAINRVVEIDGLDTKLQYDIQVIELNTQNVPVPAAVEETIIETSAPPPEESQPPEELQMQQGGKKKKRTTRKHKRRKANSLVVTK